MNEPWLKFAVSLGLTLLLEIPVSLLFRARRKELLLVLLVNILTNPAAVLLSMLTGDRIPVQIVIETVVIFVEGWYYRKYGEEIRYPYLCSVCCNIFSYGVGVIVTLL